jgi:hypothetical protein
VNYFTTVAKTHEEFGSAVATEAYMAQQNPFWPQYDPLIMQKYGGEWVVVVNGEVADHGPDPLAVREKVAKKYDLELDGVYAIAICKPEEMRV